MEEQLEFFARQTEKRLGELEKDLAERKEKEETTI